MFTQGRILILYLYLFASVVLYPQTARSADNPQLLTNGLIAGETLIVDSQQLSPDSQWLLFLTTRDVEGSTLTLRRLYRTSLITGQTIALTSATLPTLTGGTIGVGRYTISPDSQTVVFTGVFGDRLGAGQFAHLSTIPIGGGTPTVLDQIEDGGIGTFDVPQIDPTGARVLYRMGQILRSVQISGGTPTDLIDDRGNDDLIDIAKITPDGSSVVVFAQRQGDAQLTLFRIPIGGGAPTALATVADEELVSRLRLTSDGTRAVYELFNPTIVNERYIGDSIVSVALSGGGPIKLVDVPNIIIQDSALSPDGAWVVYNVEGYDDRIYSIPTIGGSTVSLIPATFTDELGRFEISADSQSVIFEGDTKFFSSGMHGIFRTPIAGGVTTQLSIAGPSGTGLTDGFALTPDGTSVIYHLQEGVFYRVPTIGGTSIALNQPSVGGLSRDPQQLITAPDGAYLLYLEPIAFPLDEHLALYRVPLAGGAPVQVSQNLVTGGSVSAPLLFTSDSRTVIYRADASVDQQFNLYVAVLPTTPVLTPRIFLPMVQP